MGRIPIPIHIRFWTHVRKTDACWLWTGYIKPNGYASVLTEKQRKEYVHRVSWNLHVGAIPAGMDVCHRCDVRHCIRPDHLFLGTPQDNTMDGWRKGRMYSAFLDPDKHALAVSRAIATRKARAGTCRVLCNNEIEEVHRMLASGVSQDSIAAAVGVGQTVISRIHRGKLHRGYDSSVGGSGGGKVRHEESS